MSILINFTRKKLRDSNEQRIRNNLNNYGVDIMKDIPYMEDSLKEHLLDIYSPKDAMSILPVILEVHGGAYIACCKEVNQYHGTYLASQGYHVVNMNYMLYPEADIRQMVREVCQVLNWIDRNAGKYGFDTEHIYLTGDSAGGHITLMTAAALNNKAIRRAFDIPKVKVSVQKFAAVCPIGSFEDLRKPLTLFFKILRYVLRKVVKNDVAMTLFDYRFYMKEVYPEVLIITTPADNLLYEHTRAMHEYMDEHGIRHIYKEYEEKSNKLEHVYNVLYPEYEESIAANQDIIAFFNAV